MPAGTTPTYHPVPKWPLYINKLETLLKRKSLSDVYKSLPRSTDFAFHESTVFHQHALRTYIGERERSSGVKVPVWAYILPGETTKPIIVFREELPSRGERLKEWPRSATSLLRKAKDLLPPFRLLQYHPNDGTRGMRGMVCALVAYYALTSGANDCSMHWDEFETCFIAALEHIRMNAEIEGNPKQHADEQPSLATTGNVSALSGDIVASKKRQFSDFVFDLGEVETAPLQPQDDVEKKGETVRAAIGSVQVRAQTSLARCIERMGNKAELLNNIQDAPVQISRQSLYPSYWPYRLHIGTHPSANSSGTTFDVFVYYTRQKPKTMVVHGQNAGVERTCLFKPFSQLKGKGTNRSNKVRYLSQYYFAVAANEGFTEEPPIDIPKGGRDSFISMALVDFDSASERSHGSEHIPSLEQRSSNSSSVASRAPGKIADTLLQKELNDSNAVVIPMTPRLPPGVIDAIGIVSDGEVQIDDLRSPVKGDSIHSHQAQSIISISSSTNCDLKEFADSQPCAPLPASRSPHLEDDPAKTYTPALIDLLSDSDVKSVKEITVARRGDNLPQRSLVGRPSVRQGKRCFERIVLDSEADDDFEETDDANSLSPSVLSSHTAAMLSGILIFNQKGENLIFRAFRNDCRPRLADVFRIQVISNAQVRSPILTLGSTTFSHVKHENIYLVAVTKSNANAALVFEFLYRLVGLGKAYFGKFDEEAVKNNFVLVYELLDEILDFGYPQNTETDTLKMYITTEGVKSERAMEDSSKITMQATGALSWRRADIKYRKNEAFVDVIEDVNLLMSATGTVLRADVNGQIIMRAYLSGTPECKFGLNDRLTLGEDHLQQPSGNKAGAKATRAAAGSVTLEDCQFHQCVKLGKFDADRIISFVPPDGEFELMRYRATENVNLPFKVHAIVNEVGKTKVEYSIAVRANYGSKLFATNVVVRIPTPLNTARITERTSQGKAKYEPEHNNIVWKIPRFTGQSEFVLSAEASLTSMTNQKAWSRPPLNLSFSLLMFTSSGLLVRYLKVFEKSNYSSVKWVRYMTRAGNYEISCHGDWFDYEHHPTHPSRKIYSTAKEIGKSASGLPKEVE
ncbi:clathrin adaptor, mu subunit [Stemphylium lycopersici]|uniref:Clathrin adaptor, mu subunit n=1 Tax=Stemphylium lycopersici TaxID=183478 RepID=A0A364NAG0_STELY|nr:clathrin adaptor, mu subunit [Stemphylium lycopersici]RAR14163.1 clathrin adaptor, mu subunit [Stemphylium lycopersici]